MRCCGFLSGDACSEYELFAFALLGVLSGDDENDVNVKDVFVGIEVLVCAFACVDTALFGAERLISKDVSVDVDVFV